MSRKIGVDLGTGDATVWCIVDHSGQLIPGTRASGMSAAIDLYLKTIGETNRAVWGQNRRNENLKARRIAETALEGADG